MPQIDNKNIIQIIPNMEIGGAEKTVLEIGTYLKNTQYEPIVLTSGGRMIENLKEEKIKVLTRKIDQKNPYKIFTNIKKFKNIFLEKQSFTSPCKIKGSGMVILLCLKTVKYSFHNNMAWSCRKFIFL